MVTAQYETVVPFELETTGGAGEVIGPDTGYYPFGTVLNLEAVPLGENSSWVRWIGEGIGSYSGPARVIQLVLIDPVRQTSVFQGFSDVLIESKPASSSAWTGFTPPRRSRPRGTLTSDTRSPLIRS